MKNFIIKLFKKQKAKEWTLPDYFILVDEETAKYVRNNYTWWDPITEEVECDGEFYTCPYRNKPVYRIDVDKEMAEINPILEELSQC